MMHEELQKGITSNPELGFEYSDSHWKSLEEKKRMEISRRGFNMIEKSEILMPHPSKGTLGVGCVTEWYQSEQQHLA
jgi:hypothetical protein